MPNILESSELFEASIRFENAAASLAELGANSEDLDESGRDALKWAGELLESVDWNAEKRPGNHVSPDLAVRATSIRPFFYNVLIDTQEEFKRAGLKDTSARQEFLSALYQLLNGEKQPDELTLDYQLASNMLHKISSVLLVEVSGNGHSPSDSGIMAFGS